MFKLPAPFPLMLIAAMVCTLSSAHAASFDCRAAKSEMEKAICSDPQLSALDEELNAVFKATIDYSPNRSALRDSQREWLRSYALNKCQEISCWRIRLLERINILKSTLGSHGYALPPLANSSGKVDPQPSESNASNRASAQDRLPQASFAEPVSVTASSEGVAVTNANASEWYIEEKSVLGKYTGECKQAPVHPSEFLESLKTLGKTYFVRDEVLVDGKPVSMVIVVPSMGGGIQYFRGEAFCLKEAKKAYESEQRNIDRYK